MRKLIAGFAAILLAVTTVAGPALANGASNSGRGLVTVSVRDLDPNGDGVFDYRQTLKSTYDRRGNLLAELSEFDTDADGTVDSVGKTEYTYDSRGNLVSRSFSDGSGETTGLSNTSTFTYDSRGNLLVIEDVIENEDYLRVSVITNTYDAQSRLLTTTVELGDDADSLLDLIVLIKNSYDRSGNLVLTTSEDPSRGDAVFLIESFTYDKHDNLLTALWEEDVDLDRVVDNRESTVNTYDHNGTLVAKVFKEERPHSLRHERTTYTYDHRGNVLTETLTRSPLDSDVVLFTEVTSNTYDVHGNLLSRVLDGIDVRGSINFRTATTNTYDRWGNLLTSVVERWNASGDRNLYTVTTNTY